MEYIEQTLRTLANEIWHHQVEEHFHRAKKLEEKENIENVLRSMGVLADGYTLNAQLFFNLLGHDWMFNMGSLTVYDLRADFLGVNRLSPGSYDFPILPLLGGYNQSFVHANNLVMVRVRFIGENALVFLDKDREKDFVIERRNNG